ncbi:MAG: PAS domain S-box protein [Myxococcales bacterium]|nr:PAS domain S-box protein [Myxococcales bacterium]
MSPEKEEGSLRRGDQKTKAELIAELEAMRTAAASRDSEPDTLALIESEERYRIVTEISRDAVTVTDESGTLIFANSAMETVFGFKPEELLGTKIQDYFDLLHPDDRDRYVSQLQSIKQVGDTVHYDPLRAQCKDGRWVWVRVIGTSYLSASGQPCILEVNQDITEQVEAAEAKQKLAEQMKEAQRLESLGVLAGGIAHDFNNLLTPILGEASLGLFDLSEDSPLHSRLQRIQKAAHRAAALTNQMLTYSGQGQAVTEFLDISKFVEETAELLEGAVSGKAELVFDLADGLPTVQADASQLSQVVMNLIINATEAIQEGAGPIVLRTGLVDVDNVESKFIVGSDTLLPGSYVYLEVIDAGCGMDEQLQSKIFDPFFTTKFTGRGLGLAAVLGIVRSHGGAIELDSVLNRGTRFRVLLPSAGKRELPGVLEDYPTEDWRGHGIVLVADDDAGVRDLMKDTLERAGMTVLCCHDGREAVEVFRRQPDDIRIVVLDRTMPNIGGEGAFDQIRQIRPDAHIILVSGYSEERAAQYFIDKGLDAFLHKPFEPMTLLEHVRRILETE